MNACYQKPCRAGRDDGGGFDSAQEEADSDHEDAGNENTTTAPVAADTPTAAEICTSIQVPLSGAEQDVVEALNTLRAGAVVSVSSAIDPGSASSRQTTTPRDHATEQSTPAAQIPATQAVASATEQQQLSRAPIEDIRAAPTLHRTTSGFPIGLSTTEPANEESLTGPVTQSTMNGHWSIPPASEQASEPAAVTSDSVLETTDTGLAANDTGLATTGQPFTSPHSALGGPRNDVSASHSTAGGAALAPVTSRQSTTRAENLDDTYEYDWEARNLDFGDEPTDETWDTWGCRHHFYRFGKGRVPDFWLVGVNPKTDPSLQIECIGCFQSTKVWDDVAELQAIRAELASKDGVEPSEEVVQQKWTERNARKSDTAVNEASALDAPGYKKAVTPMYECRHGCGVIFCRGCRKESIARMRKERVAPDLDE